MRVCQLSKHLSLVLVFFLISTFLIGCSLGDQNITATPTPRHKPMATGTPIGVSVPVCRLSSCSNLSPVAGMQRPLVDTWDNIHLFQTFDYHISGYLSYSTAKSYDFVWGADPAKIYDYRSGNPNAVLSFYMTMQRDDGTFTNSDLGHQHGLPYWQSLHPDWILYQCDKKTPAYEYKDSNMPFDITNPDFINWQVSQYIQLAENYGYDAVAVDNVNMENLFGACGHYDANGNWVQQYTGSNSDPQWQQNVLTWLTKMQSILHHLPHPMLLIANFSNGAVSLGSSLIQQILAHIDGISDESSFTDYGQFDLSAQKWLDLLQFVDTMQRQNKPYFLINEFSQTNQSTHDRIQWIISSYLMIKERLAYLYMSQIQGYGVDSRYSEYALQIGSPQSDMYQSQGVYWRDYAKGEVVVNPTDNSLSVTVPQSSVSSSYKDLYGQSSGASFTIPAHSGKVLLH